MQELLGLGSAAGVKAHLLTGGTDESRRSCGWRATTRWNRHSVLSDGNNNTVRLLDGAQEKVVNYAYEPYGTTTADAANGNAQQYTGRENDNPGDANGLYYYRARYYMPGCARFISEDPIGWASGQVNNYAYVGGNPVGWRDSSGLTASCGINGNNINIALPITFTGPGATPENIQNAITGIQSSWTGTFGQYVVTTTVTQGTMNNITLTTGPRTFQPFVNMPLPFGSAPGNVGTWHTDNTALNRWEAAHEAGHLMGLPDQYTGAGTPNAGWQNHMMGQALGAIVRPTEITSIIGMCQ